MHSAIITILQQRMHKTTTEQFWAVAITTGLCVLVLTKRESILSALPVWLVFSAIVFLTIYAVYYIVLRHMTYYKNAEDLVSLLQNVDGCPQRLKAAPEPWRLQSLVGSGFYSLWVVGAGLVSITSIL